MASGQQPKGRGRGRARTQDVQAASNDNPVAAALNIADLDISSSASNMTTTSTSQTVSSGVRGRGRRIISRPMIHAANPHWTVSELTMEEFNTNDRPPKPTELGTIGESITVIANYFPVQEFPQEGFVYQYDIQLWNKKDRSIPRRHRRLIYECWCRNFCKKYPNINRYQIVFDNDKTIFTYNQLLPDIDENGTSEMIPGPNAEDRQEHYKVTVKKVSEPVDVRLLRYLAEFYTSKTNININLDDLQVLRRMLSVVLHENASIKADFIFNRSFFSQPNTRDRYGTWDLGFGTDLWRGFYSCLTFTKGSNQLLMNLDISYKIFMKKQSFIDFARQVMVHSPCGIWQYKKNRQIQQVTLKDILEFLDPNSNDRYYRGEIEFLRDHCRNLRVRSHAANRTIKYNIRELDEPASTKTFHWNQKGKFITVENYYNEHHGIQLEYPQLPTLRMHKSSPTQQEAFVPMEFVDIEPVRVTRITDEQRARLCLQSSLKPVDCYQAIKEVAQNPHQQDFENDPFIAAWNLSVYNDMLKISARILPMPDVIFNDRHKVTHDQSQTLGVWTTTRTQFHTPSNIPDVWGLINLSSLPKEACEEFFIQSRDVAAQRGIQCPLPAFYQPYNVRNQSKEDILDALRKLMIEYNGCKFLIVILPENNPIRDEIYRDIKELCELESGLGIITQMIKLKEKEIHGNWSYSRLHNVFLKINAKLNGINSSIRVPNHVQQFFARGSRIMYVGVDLSHAGPGSSRKCSAVAAVASADDIPTKYFREVYIQERLPDSKGESWENVVNMKEIMKSLISQYEKHRDGPPKAIIIYRDGISTSEFGTVFENELTATREACVELSPVYRPCITYIVVNKRHHTRLFAHGLKNNVPAGTVVDSPDITDPTIYDFYLNSHHGDKGTSRPTHYRVLYDDNKLEPNQVQMLTYALCYLHARCTRSISIPAPVKYADLLAFRASIYGHINERSNETVFPQKRAIATNQEVDVVKNFKSERIALSSNFAADCPFFV